MAGEYVEFVNTTDPALNDYELNLMQRLIKQDIVGQIGGDTLPIGSIVKYGVNTPPTNWLLCNGQAISRTIYQDLFDIIGTTYGQGDGFTTFNLPNLTDEDVYYIIKVKQSSGVVATVVDNLNSTSQIDALSANQGKILNEKFNYSTTEKQIGVWCDGKPLYRRVINATTGDVSDSWKIITNSGNISKLTNICGYMLADTTRSIPFASPFQSIWFDVDGNGNLRCATHGDSLLNKNIEVAIEYTKSTDL